MASVLPAPLRDAEPRVLEALQERAAEKGRIERCDVEAVLLAELAESRWAGERPPPFPAIPVFVTAQRLRAFRADRGEPPFPLPEPCPDWRGFVPMHRCADGGGETCALCARAITGTLVRGCCEAHSLHLDCNAVAVMALGRRQLCMPCAVRARRPDAEVGYDLVGLGLGLAARRRLRARALAPALASAREWMGDRTFAYEVPHLRTGDFSDPCVVCDGEGPVLAEGDDALLLTCGAHRAHGACYALWRALCEEAGAPEGGCPGSAFGECECCE